MLSLVLPKGSSLEQRTLDLFATAGLEIRRAAARSQRATIDYGGPIRVVFCKPREIPAVVASGAFDVGLTGADWIEESEAKVDTLASFAFAKTSDAPWRLVLAVPTDHPATDVRDLPDGTRVATEYVNIGRRFFEEAGLHADIVRSYGATEAKIPELADAVIDVVETGDSLRHNGLRVLRTVRTCTSQVIAGPHTLADPSKRQRVHNVVRLLRAAAAGTRRTMITVRVPEQSLHTVTPLMPAGSWRAGTDLAEAGVVVLQGLAPHTELLQTTDALLAAGALDITESDIRKTVPAPHTAC
ncbi:ATP phosphoribosyltransferase [Streptomyces calvus]|uniref:ATP phosphoribosyltransferase n=1 Tax=Streptomyces calvus TaxID=67282 RepID=A0A514JJ75_9ACTN|nr:ATP phosphoribosyltransferase [Streptomyces calvus]QDI67365.1 ATP phosphoribosyltransferase [Streptomyces calvus]